MCARWMYECMQLHVGTCYIYIMYTCTDVNANPFKHKIIRSERICMYAHFEMYARQTSAYTKYTKHTYTPLRSCTLEDRHRYLCMYACVCVCKQQLHAAHTHARHILAHSAQANKKKVHAHASPHIDIPACLKRYARR